jgi:hypothetical protein
VGLTTTLTNGLQRSRSEAMAKYTEHPKWKFDCEQAGLEGPFPRQGFQSSEYHDADGAVVAHWNGDTGEGELNDEFVPATPVQGGDGGNG